ncbi:phytanoyl-CoA dioxygenase family protein [Pirellulaceae bacterium SH449]
MPNMQIATQGLERDGYLLMPAAVGGESVEQLRDIFEEVFAEESGSILARSSRGHVYAARNLIDSIPEVVEVWQTGPMANLLRSQLGETFGLVRALFFDKPPERTWSLPWHKDTSIAVLQNDLPSTQFSRATLKAGVPHVIAPDEVLKSMLTLRIHLDEVTDENGPLRVIPGSHVSSDSDGVGAEKAVTIFADAGDVLAMRPLISHSSGSSREGTKLHRRILHLEFAASDFLPDGYQWHRFVRPTANKNQQPR